MSPTWGGSNNWRLGALSFFFESKSELFTLLYFVYFKWLFKSLFLDSCIRGVALPSPRSWPNPVSCTTPLATKEWHPVRHDSQTGSSLRYVDILISFSSIFLRVLLVAKTQVSFKDFRLCSFFLPNTHLSFTYVFFFISVGTYRHLTGYTLAFRELRGPVWAATWLQPSTPHRPKMSMRCWE